MMPLKWLTRREEDEDFPPMPIPTAVMLPPGEKVMEEKEVVSNGVDLSTVPPKDILQRAATLAHDYDADKAKWGKLAEEAASRIKDLDREVQFLKLELATRINDVQTLQAQIEELRQDNSELRALHGALHAQAKHLVVQYENFHIPLPVRKRAKNGNKEKQTNDA